MGLLAPWFLGGALLVGLPIYLHLLRQQTSTPRLFSSLMFFERSTQSSIKHRRLRYLLLLALRLALLLLLALAFANPFVTRDQAPGAGKRLLIVALDDSFSMRAAGRMERARSEALALIGGLRPGDSAQVVAASTPVKFLTQVTEDAAELRAAVQSLKPGDGRTSYGDFARTLRSMASSSRLPLDVHLFSDMQKSGVPAGFTDLEMPAGARLNLHPAQSGEEPNFAVEGVTAPAGIADPKKVRILATVAGYGTREAERTVSLAVNNKVVATRPVKIPALGRATVEFTSLEAPYGFSRCEVRIDSADKLREDDRFQFAVERADPRRILFVNDARESRSLLYFRAALAAAAESSFTLESMTSEQTLAAQPTRFAFVVVSDASLPTAFEEELKKYVRAGGSVLVAAGPSIGRRPRVPVFDEPVLESKYYSRDGERFQTTGWVDPAHPSISRAGRWEGVKFYHVVRVDGAKNRVLARLTDQTPLLVEKPMGEGRVLYFASTFDNISNDFPLAPAFVPFVEQTARHLAGLQDRASVLTVAGFVELRSNRERGIAVEVVDPDGKRPFSLKEAATAETYQVDREGFYEVRRANGRHEMVAVNADRHESDLAPAADDTLALWQRTGEGTAQSNGAAARERQPRSLWWYVMLLVLGAAVVESLLASRYLRAEEEAA